MTIISLLYGYIYIVSLKNENPFLCYNLYGDNMEEKILENVEKNESKNLEEKINNLEKRIDNLEKINYKNKIKRRIYFIIMIVSILVFTLVYYFIMKNTYNNLINYL